MLEAAGATGAKDHLVVHAHLVQADMISDDNHQPPPPRPRRTRSGRIYNREANVVTDRNSQNVYTLVLIKINKGPSFSFRGLRDPTDGHVAYEYDQHHGEIQDQL